ncbi:MAG: acyl-ACP--UDP-N-acetylglucosamine O-acyltransferase [Acetobacteraceae bacterium]|nr:acyl-ACP--UDP-N-acetylglucosamine O-acyltransferase [Acetobacteraceae bacterium]
MDVFPAHARAVTTEYADHLSLPERGVQIHALAVVDPTARLGMNVQVGPFCTVGPDVEIEDGARLISHVVVDGHTRIGADAVLYPHCTVGMAPQDLKYRGEPTFTEIGARTLVREHVTIHRGTAHGRGVTRVGTDCMLMAVAHVAHDCQLGNGVIVANNVVMGGHVSIGDNAVIGGAAAIHQFVRIGRAAMIGGVSGVEADVIPFGTVLGNRARLASLNVIGLRRRGFSREQIARLRAAFKLMFRGPGVFARRVEQVRASLGEDALVAEVLAFMDAPSKRGLIRAAGIGAEPDEG